MTKTDTPVAGCRSSNIIYTDSYRLLPTPRLKKGKHVSVIVFFIVGVEKPFFSSASPRLSPDAA